jgi:hypothetical protein
MVDEVKTEAKTKKCLRCQIDKPLDGGFYITVLPSGHRHYRKHCKACFNGRTEFKNKYERKLGGRYNEFKTDLLNSELSRFELSKKYDIPPANLYYFQKKYLNTQ